MRHAPYDNAVSKNTLCRCPAIVLLLAQGKRVLIFSQFVIMLNVLEDYLRLSGWPVERIDGNVKSRDRQQAIDRFSNGGWVGDWLLVPLWHAA